MGGWHRCLRGVDHGNLAHSCEKRGRVDSRCVDNITLYKRLVYSGREGYILGGSHICLKGVRGIFWEGRVHSGRVAYR